VKRREFITLLGGAAAMLARELAGDCRILLAAGLDPIGARNEKRAAASDQLIA
jgi:hypothetical protein